MRGGFDSVRIAAARLMACGLAALLASLPAAAETYHWRPVRIGGGGFVTGIDMDSSGTTRVTRTDVYGAYLWLPSQDRWVQLVTAATMPAEYRIQNGMNEGAYEAVVAPSDPQRIYLAIKGRVFRSDDQGRHFLATATPVFPGGFDPNGPFRNSGPYLTVDPDNPDLVLFGTPADGLWRSADAGKTWARVASVPAAQDLRPTVPGHQSPGIITWFERQDGKKTGRIWAVSAGHGVVVSSDGGLSFSPRPADAAGPTILTQGTFAPDGTFYGVDGETKSAWRFQKGAWQNLTALGMLPGLTFASVGINPRNGLILVIDQGGKIFRSTDGGNAWKPVPHRSRPGDGDPPWMRVANLSYFAMSRILFDPLRADRVWTGAGTGVYYADLGNPAYPVTWVSQTRGIEELVANDVTQSPGQPPLFAAWDFGIHRKPDLDAFSTGYGPAERVIIAAQQVARTAADPRFLVTNASDTRQFCCSEDGNAVMAGYSSDGGLSWTKFATLPTPPGTRADDPWRMSFGTIAVSSGDTSNIVWEPTYFRSAHYTTDRGKTWSRVVLDGERLPLTGSHADYYLARRTLTADPVRAGVFYLVHSGGGANQGLQGVWRTEDGGARWRKIFIGEIAPFSGYAAKLRAVPGRAGDLFFTSSVAGDGDRDLRRSRDGGVTWQRLVKLSHVDDIAFGKSAEAQGAPTIFLSGRVSDEYGIWRSTDDGETWLKLATLPMGTLDQVSIVGADPDRFGRVYLGYVGSGFLYGEPAACTAKTFAFTDKEECAATR